MAGKKRKTAKKSFDSKLLTSVTFITLILLAILITYYVFFFSQEESWHASLIDQLAIEEGFSTLTRDFNNSCTFLLNASNFKVKYFSGEEISVNFYKDLPSKAGKIVILRAHSAVNENSTLVDLFTSEPFVDGKHLDIADQLSIGIFLASSREYFTINPTFIKNPINPSMKGEFDNSLIIMMGCDSMNNTSMAKVFVDRGAKVVVGWTQKVDLRDSDNSTLQFLHYLLAKNPYTIESAVNKVNSLNHSYGAKLDFYPKNNETRDYILPTAKNNSSLNLLINQLQILPMPLAKRKQY